MTSTMKIIRLSRGFKVIVLILIWAAGTFAFGDNCGLPLDEMQLAWLNQMSLSVHHNGNPNSCGEISNDAILAQIMEQVLREMDACTDANFGNKFWFESFFTNVVHSQFSHHNEGIHPCTLYDNLEEPVHHQGFFGFCDRGPWLTPPQPDKANLVTTLDHTLPCRFYTREGLRVNSLAHLIAIAQEKLIACLPTIENCESAPTLSSQSITLDLYAVPAGRVFMFAPKFIGEIFTLTHILGASSKTMSLEVLSLEPRVLEVRNFVSVEESRSLVIDKAKHLERSYTGVNQRNKEINSMRTSENTSDERSELAQVIKRRGMATLGFDRYYESHADGLQVLRYNRTKAYATHMDYFLERFVQASDPYDYDSSRRGGNRFATILFYMNNVTEGGETVFPYLPSTSQEKHHSDLDTQGLGLGVDSWEASMVKTCRTRLAIKPYETRAILFYSQKPNGAMDITSAHGGCPVISGIKWAANLWVWSAPRAEYKHAPLKRDALAKGIVQQS